MGKKPTFDFDAGCRRRLAVEVYSLARVDADITGAHTVDVQGNQTEFVWSLDTRP